MMKLKDRKGNKGKIDISVWDSIQSMNEITKHPKSQKVSIGEEERRGELEEEEVLERFFI